MKRRPLHSRCPCGAVDVHTHVVPARFPHYAGGRGAEPRWPTMVEVDACHRSVVIEDRVFRTVPSDSWDPAVRTGQIADRGLAHQVLSPMPELLSYWLEPADGEAMCRFLNDFIAGLAAHDLGRFTGLGAVPLQDMDAAIRVLEHAASTLGLAGVEVASHVNGTPVGHPSFQPFFEAAQALDMVVFVHALRPTGLERLVGPAALEYALGYPTEVGLAAASMITGGTLARFPRLRVAFSHGAGTLGQMLPRLEHAWNVLPGFRVEGGPSPRELARRMFVDDLVYDGQAIRHLVDLFGPTQLMLGSDYPFAIQDPDPVGRLATAGLDPATHSAVLRDNALRWIDGPHQHTVSGD